MRKKVVLITDGNETKGNCLKAAHAYATETIGLDIVPVSRRSGPEVRINSFRVSGDGQVAPGSVVELGVEVFSSGTDTGQLRLSRDGMVLYEERVHLKKGMNYFRLNARAPEKGISVFEIEVIPRADTIRENNRAWASVMTRSKARALLLGSNDHLPFLEQLLPGLRKQGMTGEIGGMERFPKTLAELGAYDLVVLSNISAPVLGRERMQLLRSAIHDLGVGLVMFGGPKTLSAGNYLGTELEMALPVEMKIRHRKVIPHNDVVLILHTCEFENGNYWAKQISKASLEALRPTDRIGLLLFSPQGQTEWLFELTPAKEKEKLLKLIDQCEPSDMPSFAPSFKLARNALAQSTASGKHIIVISDGDPAAPAKEDIAWLMERHITVSAVAINPHTPRDVMTLQGITQLTKGRYYFARDPRQLPRIFVQEVRFVQRNAVQWGKKVPRVLHSSTLLKGLSGTFPPVNAYLLTSAKNTAVLPLVVGEEDNDPLLATWQYGLGRATVFCSDFTSSWLPDWLGWEGKTRLLENIIAYTRRQVITDALQIHYAVEGERIRVSVEAFDASGSYMELSEVRAARVRANGKSDFLEFKNTEPGRWETDFPADKPGVDVLAVQYRLPDGRIQQQIQPLTIPPPLEFERLSPNFNLLEKLRQDAGSHARLLPVNAQSFNPFKSDLPPAVARRSVLNLVLILLSIAFLLDAALRRVTLRNIFSRQTPIQVLQHKTVRSSEPVERPRTAEPGFSPVDVPDDGGNERVEEREGDDYISRLKRAKKRVDRSPDSTNEDQ